MAIGILVASATTAFPLTLNLDVAGGAMRPALTLLPDLNVPDAFARRVRDRLTIDDYQARHGRIELESEPATIARSPARRVVPGAIRVVHAERDGETRAWRAAHAEPFIPRRGFRAPILEGAGAPEFARRNAEGLPPADRAVADMVDRRLAHDGVLATLVHAVSMLGPEGMARDPTAGMNRLRNLGFPADLLRHFRWEPDVDAVPGAEGAVLAPVAGRLEGGGSVDALLAESRNARFEFIPTEREFRVASESGDEALGLFRLQVGGGWRDGIVPGGPLHAIAQLVDAFPAVDFLVSVPAEVAAPFEQFARGTFSLRRAHQFQLCVEESPVAAWAQDNGKAGVLAGSAQAGPIVATLVPRYANQGEGLSVFMPGESYLADGLRAAGHRVVHSPLLFQGGNLLPVRHPRTGERILLLGEGEIHRNVALGLTSEQVLEAFRREMGVDRCLVLPCVSYHLDFDVSVRAVDDRLLVFLNDTTAAVRRILELGIAALERHGALTADVAGSAADALASDWNEGVWERLRRALPWNLTETNAIPQVWVRAFATQPTDDAAGNFRTFLLALDLLEAEWARPSPKPSVAERANYLDALRNRLAALRGQTAAVEALGWPVVRIPSLPDLGWGLNYLNGVHHRDGYAMPVADGFYASLDRLALTAFQTALGPGRKITAIRSAACQRMQGGVHCLAAAYPRVLVQSPGRPNP